MNLYRVIWKFEVDGMVMYGSEKWYDSETLVKSHKRYLESQHIGIEYFIEKMVVLETKHGIKILRDERYSHWN